MRSKIDDLLDELGDLEESPVPRPAQNQAPFVQTKKPTIHKEIDDLLDLVNDIDSPGLEKPSVTSSYQMPVVRSNRLQKCYPLCIGGASLDVGLCYSSSQLKCCNKMRCTKCDLSVKRFLHKA